MNYRIIREYLDSNRRARTIRRGLTLDEAQSHCRDPETASSTATGLAARRITRRCGPWRDTYSYDR